LVVKTTGDTSAEMQLDIRRTTTVDGPRDIANILSHEDHAHLASVYKTDEDCEFVQAMVQVHAKINVIITELHEEYFGVDDDDRRGLQRKRRSRRYLEALKQEYKAYEKAHKERFGKRDPADEIMYSVYQVTESHHEELIEQIYREIKVDLRVRKPRKQQKRIRHVTVETDDE
jgi:hypothetical protein